MSAVAKENAAVPPGTAAVRPGAGDDSIHITIRGLSKKFQDVVIYDNFDLDIPRGKFVSVFGRTVAASPRSST